MKMKYMMMMMMAMVIGCGDDVYKGKAQYGEVNDYIAPQREQYDYSSMSDEEVMTSNVGMQECAAFIDTFEKYCYEESGAAGIVITCNDESTWESRKAVCILHVRTCEVDYWYQPRMESERGPLPKGVWRCTNWEYRGDEVTPLWKDPDMGF